MVAPRLSLEDALERVADQENLLTDLYRQNPEHVLEYPADMAVIEIFRAAIRCIPRNDPAITPMEHLIFDFEMKRLNVKASQLLPAITSLRGALQSKVNARRARGDVPNLRTQGRWSHSHHRDNPPTPPVPQYRPTNPMLYKNGWSSSMWADAKEVNR